MNYTSCEKLMWAVLSTPMFKYVKHCKPDWEMSSYKKCTKHIYREIIDRTDDIGTLKENSLRSCLTGGAVWLAAFEAAQGKMDEQLFADMVVKTMEAPIIRMFLKAHQKGAFTREGQEKLKADGKKTNLRSAPCNWNIEVVLGRDQDEYSKIYHKCGLCGLGKQENLFHLVKHMCVLDYASVDLLGGRLFRTQTLANGGSCCDFYICRKGSRWEKERASQQADQ